MTKDSEIKKVIELAGIYAADSNSKVVETHHLFASLMTLCNDCRDYISSKTNLDKLFDDIIGTSRMSTEGGGIISYNPSKMRWSDELMNIFKYTPKSAIHMSTLDLFALILSQENSLLKTLESYNITITDLNNYMNNKVIEDDVLDDITMDTFLSNDDKEFINTNKKNMSKKQVKDGDTPVLDGFCRDITRLTKENLLDPVIGREREVKRVSQILSRRKKANPILIGAPGVGKTAIVEGLAQLIVKGEVSRLLQNKRIMGLDLTQVVAGTKYRGQFEERMKIMLEELKDSDDVILFIDEIHTIVGAGNSDGGLDVSNILKPALARGEIQVIGATTLDEYREKIEKDGALTRRFQEVLIEEPNINDTIEILLRLRNYYEDHHKVKYSDEIISECVKLADRYITDRAMPDKAIDIMDEVGASTNITFEIPQEIKELEVKKEEIIKRKMDVVKQQRYELAADLRDEEKNIIEELQRLRDEWLTNLGKNSTEITMDMVTDTMSTITGIPLSKINVQENEKLLKMEDNLCGIIIGQDEAITKISKSIKRNRLGIKDKNKPLGSFILLGSSGVGKTLTAKVMAEYIFGDKDCMVRFDMTEYMEKHSVSKLIGAPPGYVGYGEGGQLTERVRKKPYSVILFDEIEKAHDDVFNILLQLLDEGHITDSLGRKVNFKNTLILMTSNIGVKESVDFGKPIGFSTPKTIDTNRTNIIQSALKKRFKPEFLNRLDDIITYNNLSKDNIIEIVKLELKKVSGRVDEMGYKLNVGENMVNHLAEIGFCSQYGARPIHRAIQTNIEDEICEAILKGDISSGDEIIIDYVKEKVKIKKV